MAFIPPDMNLVRVVSFQIHVCSLETGKPLVCVGGSPGDFTCINLKDAPPHLLVCGNKDRRWGWKCYINTMLTANDTLRVLLFAARGRWKQAAFKHKNLKSTDENRMLIKITATICLLWLQPSSLSPELLHKTKKSMCPSNDNICQWAHNGSVANLALQMRNSCTKEPFSSIFHLLAAAAVHQLAGKQKSAARLCPDLPPLVPFNTKAIRLLSSWLDAKDKLHHIV